MVLTEAPVTHQGNHPGEGDDPSLIQPRWGAATNPITSYHSPSMSVAPNEVQSINTASSRSIADGTNVAVPASDSSLTTSSSSNSSIDQGFTNLNLSVCRYCPKTFKRTSDFERHINKHERKVTYDCPAVGCSVKGRNGKHRHDKLTDHIRKAHGMRTEYGCPVEGCQLKLTGAQRELFGVHVRNHVESFRYGRTDASGVSKELLGAIGNAASTTNQKCPIPLCYRRLNIKHIQQHLRDHHDETSREVEAAELAKAGYNWQSCLIICPVCGRAVTDHATFCERLEEMHLTTNPEHVRQCSRRGDRAKPFWERIAHARTCELPSCGERLEKWAAHTRHAHILSLLRNPSEIMPYREKILKLCPEFGSHPVFDDLRSVHHHSGSGRQLVYGDDIRRLR